MNFLKLQNSPILFNINRKVPTLFLNTPQAGGALIFTMRSLDKTSLSCLFAIAFVGKSAS